MGILSAMALSDEELNLTLEEQIAMHLATNCYPPVPAYMVEPAISALDAVNDCCGEHMIKLPEGVLFKDDNYARAWDIVESLRLEYWVSEEEL